YDALSYTWGGEQKSRTIICDDSGMSVTQNLFDALQALRSLRNDCGYLWVDAVCIDQENNKEKALQVRNMLLIYQKATTVVVWLGNA
ncbi:heterokaryon incompatibility, partial [Ophiobolus disseminans]